MIRLIDIRHTATSSLPVDVMNCNCVQDSLARLREALKTADAGGIYYETDEAPSYLVKARENLFAWIKEARAQIKRRQ
jgi:hypothetical protein